MTAPQQTEEYLAARLESCKLLGLNPDDLSPQEAIRADIVTVLRLSLDNSQGQLLAGGNADPTKVLAVAETLSRLIPEQKRARDEKAEKEWHDQVWDFCQTQRAIGRADAEHEVYQLHLEIERKTAEIAELRAELTNLRAVLDLRRRERGELVRPVDPVPFADEAREIDWLKGLVAEQAAEIERLKADLAVPTLVDVVPLASPSATASASAPPAPQPPQPVSSEESERPRQRVNAIQPPASYLARYDEPWRPYISWFV